MNTLDALVSRACNMAALAAAEYLRRNNLRVAPEALSVCLKSWVKAKLPEAMRDAREALECHMDQVAGATFAASMAQAGIEAAKEASRPKEETVDGPSDLERMQLCHVSPHQEA